MADKIEQKAENAGKKVRAFFRWIDNHWYKIILTVIAIAFLAMVLGLFRIANAIDYIYISGDLDVH